MSFLYLSTYKKSKHRKEQDSLWAIHFRHILFKQTERASAFAPRGSLTVEAALVVPIFFLAMLCLVYLFEMMSIQTAMRNALYSVGREVSEQAYISSIISTSAIRSRIVKNVGEERIERSVIVGGVKGIDCSASSSDWNTAIMDLVVEYEMEVPVLMFRIPITSKREELRIKGWTGYVEKRESTGANEVVYITEHGSVYHNDMGCTYLDVAIKGIIANTIEDARNDSGGKYYACELCGDGAHYGILYVSTYGNRYHSTLNCNKIKRNIYAVPREDVAGMGGCSKCVK